MKNSEWIEKLDIYEIVNILFYIKNEICLNDDCDKIDHSECLKKWLEEEHMDNIIIDEILEESKDDRQISKKDLLNREKYAFKHSYCFKCLSKKEGLCTFDNIEICSNFKRFHGVQEAVRKNRNS